MIERHRGAQLVMGDVTPLAAPGQQLLDRAGNDLGEGTLCCVLVRHIPNAHRRIIHEVPPLSATGQVTPRGCRRGATAAIKGTVRSPAPGIHAPPLRLACDFRAANRLGIMAEELDQGR